MSVYEGKSVILHAYLSLYMFIKVHALVFKSLQNIAKTAS